MIRFTFKKGLVFREGLKRWTIIGRTAFGKIKLECDEGEPRTMSRDELYQAVLLNTMSIDEQSLNVDPNVLFTAVPRDLSTFPKHHQQNARRRHIYMQKLTDSFTDTNAWIREQTAKIAAEIGDTVVPSVSSIKRWWRQYRYTQCVTKLTDRRTNSGRRRDGVIQVLFEEAVNEIYLDPQKRSGQDVYGSLVEKINQYNKNRPDQSPLTCPVESTVYRWLRNLDQNVADEARLGKDLAARKARWVKGMATADFPLHRVEIDHTPLDVLVIDLATNLPLGRPWITVAIDRYSRVILGFYISFRTPSAQSVLQCLKRAILPKAGWGKIVDLHREHPGYGIPHLVAVDNGMELHAEAVQMVCGEMGISMLYCPAGQPEFKGAVERVIGTIQRSVMHKLPGTVFSCVDERGDYPAEQLAAIDLKTLTQILIKWIVDEYHHTPHRALGMTPAEKWQQGIANVRIELPAHPQLLDVLTGLPESRTVWHYGVELDGLYYNNEHLQVLRSRARNYRTHVQLKRYEDDVSYIHVFDDEAGSYFKVPVTQRFANYADGMTLHQHLLIRQRTRFAHGNKWNDEHLLRVKAEIQSMIREALRAKKLRDRKRAASLDITDSEQVFSDESSDRRRSRNSSRPRIRESQQPMPDSFDIGQIPDLNSSPNPKYQGDARGY
ncbi:hypothetical protein WS75_26040 [Burkholderia sp. FL-7-2-10-S1-D7]|uniref:DDE-type integrase/transposase/recombinase n=1 Tax=Burkholderia sp. FL-7-2-10-S1-D7 TaxID=1637866 RepID=UPI000752127C|nr:DDE-type integrase/transposase/recombinase [Burkholderia sp. FL-7-2-10-S1-D7]KVF69475.1 hypothetical protein WS75_26040 [Burkholderia sp. FL-7-2-10-S1-D7]